MRRLVIGISGAFLSLVLQAETNDAVRKVAEPAGCPDFEIERPRQSGEIVPAARFGVTTESEDIGPALQKAFDWCVGRAGVTLHLETGALYTIRTPVRMTRLSHFIFDGRGAKIRQDRTIREKMGNLWTVHDCRHVVIRGFSADWNWDTRPLASFGRIERVEGDSFDFRFVDYEKFPWRDLRVAEISEADALTRSPGVDDKAQLHFEFYLGKFAPKAEWIGDDLLRVTGGGTDWNRRHLHFLKKGHCYRMYHSYYEGGAFFFGSNSRHVTFEDIDIFSTIGKNFHFAGMYRWQLLRVRCMPPPNCPRRVVSSTADGYGHERCWGGFKMLDCVFAAGNDDFINFQDSSVFCMKTASNVVETVNYRGSVPARGETVRLRGPRLEDLMTVARVISADRLPNGHVSPGPWGKLSIDGWRFELDRPIPFLTNGSAVVLCETKWNSGDVLIRGCRFEGTEGSGRFQASNVTVENCVFRDVCFSPMRIWAEYTRNAWCEGHGVTNMVVRNCRFERCAHGRRMDRESPWANIDISAGTPFGAGIGVFRDILIENCVFRNPAGLAVRACGVENLMLRGNAVEGPDGTRREFADYVKEFACKKTDTPKGGLR